MLSATDCTTVFDFVKNTGEGNIRKMMNGTKMTAPYLGIFFKLARACSVEDFAKYAETGTFPQSMKFTPDEKTAKETFWKTAEETLAQMGLVSKTKAA